MASLSEDSRRWISNLREGSRPTPNMRLATRFQLGGIALREGLRVLALPWHLLAFAFRRKALARRMKALLQERPPAEENHNAGERFRQRAGLSATPKRILIACGEASGEAHAIQLVQTLRAAHPAIQIEALGGSGLTELGVRVHVNLVDRAVMGIKGVLALLPFFFRATGTFIEVLEDHPPDLFIPIDNPGFNLLLAEQCKKRGIPVLYYICPQYWAWGPWRMRRFCKAVAGALALLPFEPPLFETMGLPTACSGHPLLQSLPSPASAPERELVLALLPGSRSKEIQRNLPGMLRVWEAFLEKHPGARCKILQSKDQQANAIREMLQVSTHPPDLVIGDPMKEIAKARLALVKSGTGSLQTALLGTPLVVVYKLGNRLEEWMGKRLLTVPWIAAANLVIGSPAIPEFCFAREELWEEIMETLDSLWEEGPRREVLIAALKKCREALEGPGADRLVLDWIAAENP